MRIKKVREIFEKRNIDSFLITDIKNIRYLSGFTGDEGMMLITPQSEYLIVDGRFTEQAEKESKVTVVDYNGSFIKSIEVLLKKDKSKKCGFEGRKLTYLEADNVMKTISAVKWSAERDIVETVRIIKEPNEIEAIKKALKIALDTYEYIKKQIVPGVREIDIANEIEYKMKKLGATGPSFDTIIASGTRSSLPHGTATNKMIKNGDSVVIDMGAVWNGYCSDITRTVFVGEPSKEQQRVYDLVEKAQKFAIDAINPGKKCSDINQVAVDEFKKNSMEKYFVHSLGHGVGLDVHERPYVSEKSEDVFAPGMVVTVEPGLYLPDKFGVRIEDMILLEER